jgi:undecaprenyl pyrophosphate phosphatase UppP
MILIFATIAVAVVVGAISIRLWTLDYIKQHKHPDRARLRLLWAQLWFYIACTTMFSVSEAVLYVRGEDKTPARWLFLFAIFAWALIGTILKIRRCRKIVASHDA